MTEYEAGWRSLLDVLSERLTADEVQSAKTLMQEKTAAHKTRLAGYRKRGGRPPIMHPLVRAQHTDQCACVTRNQNCDCGRPYRHTNGQTR